MRKHVTDYLLYRWRYVLGYLFLIAIIGVVISLASLYVPGALRAGEIDSSLQSGSLSIESMEPGMVVDLPYHVLQRLSFMALGVTTLAIKLPSIILGSLTVLGIFLLIRTWFRRNVAIITTVMAVTSTQFLFLIQDGTPNIMYSFLAIWILFAATYVTRKKMFGTLWKVLAGVFMAAALYTPLGIYLVIAVLTTAIFHPHIRYTILRFSRPKLWIAVILGLVSIVPLVYASAIDQTTLLALLGLSDGQLHLKQNLITVATDIFGFGTHGTNYLVRPLYSIGFALLAFVGIYKLITYKHTARSYITLTLSVFMVPLVIFNPVHITYLFPLACLMLALGVATMITSWYKLFPRNPYARVAGLIPLSILVVGISYSGIARYMNNYAYNPEVLIHYSNDLRLLDRQINARSADAPLKVIVNTNEQPFYNLVAHYDKRFSAHTTAPKEGKIIIVTHDAKNTKVPNSELVQIITSRFATDADRFYIYKSTVK
jgi:hypothetical protein